MLRFSLITPIFAPWEGAFPSFARNDMKLHHHAIALPAWLLVTCLALAACGQGGKAAGELAFDSLRLDCKKHVYGDTAMPAVTVGACFTYVKQASEEGMAQAINARIIEHCFGHDYDQLPIDEAMKAYITGFMNDYLSEFDRMLCDDDELPQWMYEDSFDMHGNVVYYGGNLLTYRYEGWQSIGGPNDYYFTLYLNIDLRTLQPVTLDSLFMDDTTDMLTDLLWNQLMSQTHCHSREEVEDLGYCTVSELEPTKNIRLDRKGVTFHYNLFEIAPYVMGYTEITLLWPVLQPLLRNYEDVVELVR